VTSNKVSAEKPGTLPPVFRDEVMPRQRMRLSRRVWFSALGYEITAAQTLQKLVLFADARLLCSGSDCWRRFWSANMNIINRSTGRRKCSTNSLAWN
jgi:hypothetical protein